MTNQMIETTLRLLLLETLWLEPEQFARAKEASAIAHVENSSDSEESQRWQAYLNALASDAFEDWLAEKLPQRTVRAIAPQDLPNSHAASYLSADEFKLCIVAAEQVLNEQIAIPKSVVEQPELAAHCYVFIEVLEEDAQAIARGFLRYDELLAQISQRAASHSSEHSLPLSALDLELNHLVSYIQYSHPSTIPLPAASTQPARPIAALADNVTRLGNWLEESLTEGWQAIDQLINPTANLAWSTRNKSSGMRGGKLLNLGLQMGQRPIALLVAVAPENDEKIGINVQVLPTGDDATLPPQLKVTLISSTDKVLQEVSARERDNYIQLRSFKGRAGIRFRIEVALDEIVVSESFEL